VLEAERDEERRERRPRDDRVTELRETEAEQDARDDR
jgi:hypothetical protein